MTTRKPPKGQKPNFFPGSKKTGGRRQKSNRKEGDFSGRDAWFYGDHAVIAALENPKRKLKRLLITHAKMDILREERADLFENNSLVEQVSSEMIQNLLPENAIHQGIACQPNPLHEYGIEDIPSLMDNEEQGALAILDQVTDPHNVGAILRSAAAFGITAVIMQDRHSPPVTGVLARSASGAVEMVPIIRVNNLARALDKISEYGFWRIGLDGTADQNLDVAIKGSKKVALILGSEGKGLRRLTEEKCDLLGKLPMSGKIESLNVSNAAAISFYELAKNVGK
jgi:23S rRNA (guanosine2251-2'-O)-methyltransferase